MTTIDEAGVDADKLDEFVFRAVDEVGATLNAALVVMGDRLGLYRALAGRRRADAGELAARTGTAERYVREWLNAQAAGGYVDYDPARAATACRPSRRSRSRTRTAPPTCRASSRSRSVRCSTRRGSPTRSAPAPGSAGTSTTTTSSTAASASSGPATTPTCSTHGSPRSTASSSELERGRPRRRRRLRPRRLDDPHGPGLPELDVRRLRLPRRLDRDGAPAGTRGRRRGPRALRGRPGAEYAGERLRPRDDVRLPARHGRPRRRGPPRPLTLAPDGTWMIVEPAAGDRVEDNLNPVGRAYYGFSTLLCTPASLSQDVGLALGAQAGPARIAEVVTRGRLHALPPAPPKPRSTWSSRCARDAAAVLAATAGPSHVPEPRGSVVAVLAPWATSSAE